MPSCCEPEVEPKDSLLVSGVGISISPEHGHSFSRDPYREETVNPKRIASAAPSAQGQYGLMSFFPCRSESTRNHVLSKEDILSELLIFSSEDLSGIFQQVLKLRPELLQVLPTHAESSVKSFQNFSPLKSPSYLISPPGADTSQIQFAAPLFFADQSSGEATVTVMRIGNLDIPSSIKWETRDGSAKQGMRYVAASGVVEFAAGVTYAEIKVELLRDYSFDPLLEFMVAFKEEDMDNTRVHRSHMMCRVKIISGDVFPTNRYKTKLLKDGPDGVMDSRLSFEYAKMTWKSKSVTSGGIKCLAADFLANIVLITQMGLLLYIVDDLFVPSITRAASGFDDYTKLLSIALCFVIPDYFIYMLSFRRCYWQVAGSARMHLQSNLLRKFMHYNVASRKTVDSCDVVLLAFNYISEVVGMGYMSIFPLVKHTFQLLLLLLFQVLGQKVIMGKQKDSDILAGDACLFAGFPVLMVLAFAIRSSKSVRLMRAAMDSRIGCSSCTIDVLKSFSLIADYAKQGDAIRTLEEKLEASVLMESRHLAACTNNVNIPRALSALVLGGWLFVGGLWVIEGDLALGSFLATIIVIKQMGACWGSIFASLLGMKEVQPQLKILTRLMNLATDDNDHSSFVQKCDEVAREFTKNLTKQLQGSNDLPVDQLPIRFNNVTYTVGSDTLLEGVSFDVKQGQLHAISSMRGMGKSNLLYLCGGCRLTSAKEGGYVFIPQHLRVVHVSKEPLFILGTLYQNLIYGVPAGDEDAHLERVVSICKRLGLPQQTLDRITDASSASIDNWNEVLAMSSRHLLSIARGLIANPEVLVIHKPSLGMGPSTKAVVFGALRKFAELRGLEQDDRSFFSRRPRTCIYSAVDEDDFRYADVVHRPLATQTMNSAVKAIPS